MSELRARPLAPATVIKAAQIAGKIFDVAVRDRRHKDNPARDLDLPVEGDTDEMTIIAPARITRLAETIDRRYGDLVLVGCHH